MISTRKRHLGSDFCWFWHRLFLSPIIFLNSLSSGSAALFLSLVLVGCLRNPPSVVTQRGGDRALCGRDKSDGLQLCFLPGLLSEAGPAQCSAGTGHSSSPLALCRFPLWACLAFSLCCSHLCLQPAFLPLPFPQLLCLLLQLCFKSLCFWIPHLQGCDLFSELEEWAFLWLSGSPLLPLLSGSGAHQSQHAQSLAFRLGAKKRKVAAPLGIYGS